MKTRLPKKLLVTLLAAMAVNYSHAAVPSEVFTGNKDEGTVASDADTTSLSHQYAISALPADAQEATHVDVKATPGITGSAVMPPPVPW